MGHLSKPRKNSPWSDEHIITAYELARAGLSEVRIASALGVMPKTLREWRARYPLLHAAIKRGKAYVTKDDGSPVTFGDYIYKRLPDDLRELWEEINACEKAPSGIARIEAMLTRAGMRARQYLFCHALVMSNFNASAACRKVNINRPTLDKWIELDPDFPRLMDEILWHKKNFMENELLRLVKKGDPAAVIHVNKTFNKDRGYGNSIEVHNTGTVQHAVAVMSVGELSLPIEVRQQILLAMRTKQDSERLTVLNEEE